MNNLKLQSNSCTADVISTTDVKTIIDAKTSADIAKPVLHGTLVRQLKKSNLSFSSLPPSLEQWQQFLDRIQRTYSDADHDRYRLERSMSISSREIIDLNSKLINAQSIALMGYWLYQNNGEIYWSNDCISILGEEFTSRMHSYQQLIIAAASESQESMQSEIDRIIKQGGKTEFELNIGSKWFHFMLMNNLDNINSEHTNLREAMTGIVMDITIRKEYEIQVDKLNKQLITSAREVGRADISTSILHNIGNVLNSVNSSVGLLAETISIEKNDLLNLACKKLEENAQDSKYLTKDKKGQLILPYIKMLCEEMRNDANLVKSECEQLEKGINHIKSIIKSQQSWAKTSTVKTNINLKEFIDSIIRLTGINFESHNIKLTIHCFYEQEFYCDETKLTQILVNLLCNAKDAITMYYQNNHIAKDGEIFLDVRVNEQDAEQLQISVSDNGIGIDDESLNKIFNFGYTSKVEGHGFGLHSSILAAHEMNGDLVVKSRGTNQGATFILSLPLKQ